MPRTPRAVLERPAGWRRLALLLLAGSVGVSGLGLPQVSLAQQVPQATPQAVQQANDDAPLTQPQLEQLLAPIALYPDDLLMQMLMAATYPLEIVQAERWLRQGENAQLQGEALATALQSQPWDPSVKSLLPFPDVLRMMNEQLDWTQQVGDAVLAQQTDVLNTVQVLRGRAQAAGQLQSGPQQTVTVAAAGSVAPSVAAATVVVAPPPQVITIAPTNPTVVYVPAYNPTVVYGTWPYPSYPPTYYPPPPSYGIGNALLTGMAFATGAAIVGSLWGWGSPNWGRGNVDVNVNRYNNINVNRAQISNNTWQHDSSHRGGVAYRNNEVNNRYRGANAPGNRAESREQFRGRAEEARRPDGGNLAARDQARPNAGAQRPGGNDRPNAGAQRPAAGDRPNAGAQRPEGGDRPNAGQRPATADRPNQGAQRPAGGDRPGGADRPNASAAQRPAAAPAARPAPQALQGQGQGRDVRAASERGAASRQAQPAARAQASARPQGGGGGARGGGGGGGGRGGR